MPASQAKWNTLFADGVRQVRARYPNGNPQDSSGICFSSTNRPGEGCDGWLSAEGGYGGSLPGSNFAGKVSLVRLVRVLGSWVKPCGKRLGIRKGGKGAVRLPNILVLT